MIYSIWIIMRTTRTYDEDGNLSMVPATPRDPVRIAAGVMELHWQPYFEFTVPNTQTYPWFWLWDSCFHSIIWDSLGDDRAGRELRTVFDYQAPSGFVP